MTNYRDKETSTIKKNLWRHVLQLGVIAGIN